MANDLVPHSWCWECYRAYFRVGHFKRKSANNKRSTAWQIANKETAKASVKKWKDANREYLRAYDKVKYDSDVEAARARTAAWRKANPEKVAERNRRRRAAKHGATGSHTQNDIAELLKLQRSRCVYCNKSLKSGYHIDHILPLSKGGSNAKSNLQLTCAKCNLTKGSRDPIAHARVVGLLL